jgi:hypothetical protein
MSKSMNSFFLTIVFIFIALAAIVLIPTAITGHLPQGLDFGRYVQFFFGLILFP